MAMFLWGGVFRTDIASVNSQNESTALLLRDAKNVWPTVLLGAAFDGRVDSLRIQAHDHDEEISTFAK